MYKYSTLEKTWALFINEQFVGMPTIANIRSCSGPGWNGPNGTCGNCSNKLPGTYGSKICNNCSVTTKVSSSCGGAACGLQPNIPMVSMKNSM